MKLKDRIEKYKSENKNTFEHEFKNGIKFKGGNGIKLHEWLDQLYSETAIEFKTIGTKKTANFIDELLNTKL